MRLIVQLWMSLHMSHMAVTINHHDIDALNEQLDAMSWGLV